MWKIYASSAICETCRRISASFSSHPVSISSRACTWAVNRLPRFIRISASVAGHSRRSSASTLVPSAASCRRSHCPDDTRMRFSNSYSAGFPIAFLLPSCQSWPPLLARSTRQSGEPWLLRMREMANPAQVNVTPGPDDRPHHGSAQAGGHRWSALYRVEDTRFGGKADWAE